MRFFKNPYINPSGGISANSPLLSTDEASTEAIEMMQTCVAAANGKASIHDGGLYVGVPGIAWAAVRILNHTNSPNLMASTQSLVNELLSVTATQQPRDKEEHISFLLGLPGIWVSIASFYHLIGDTPNRDRFTGLYAQLATQFTALAAGGNLRIFSQGSDELFIGRAGYLCGLHALQKMTGETLLSEEAVFGICDAMVASGQSYAKKHNSACPLMYAYHGTEYLGAAHGLVGVLFALMLFPDYLSTRTEARRLVEQSIDYLIQVTPSDTGNLPAATDELPPRHHRTPDRHELVHWCHGAAGICHGVAGSGYVQLALYRLTGRPDYLTRAQACATFMLRDETFRREARVPDAPHSLFEGRAGTAVFLADLAAPDASAFPFMDPF